MTDPAGFQGKSFQTAAARRSHKPIVFGVEHWQRDPEDDDDAGEVIKLKIMVDPNLDVVRLGHSFGSFGKTLQALNVKKEEGEDGYVSSDDKLRIISNEVPKVRQAVRECLTPPSRLKWDQVMESFDIQALGEVIRWMTAELSGQDPTEPNSSPNGSPATGITSTDGALPVASTSETSPTPVA